MPSYITSFIVIDFMPHIFKAFFRHLGNMEILLAHIGMKCFEIFLHIFLIEFPHLFFVNLREDFFDLSIMLFCFLLDSVLLSFAVLVNEIVEFNRFPIGCNNLSIRRLQQELDAVCDCRLNFQVWLDGGSCQVQLP